MSAHVLLNLLNKLKRDKMRGLYNHILGLKTLGFAICVMLKASFHNISRKSVNH